MPGYAFTTLDDPSAGAGSTITGGINNAGVVVGTYDGKYGFIYDDGSYTTLVYPVGATLSSNTYLGGINNDSQIVGYVYQVLGIFASYNQGFIYSGGNFTNIYDPSSFAHIGGGTVATGMNDSGQVVGYYYDDGNYSRTGFLYSGGQYTTISDPNAGTDNSGNISNEVASGINNFGQIVGFYTTANGSPAVSFIYSGGQYTGIFDPNANTSGNGSGTYATGINNFGQIVGFYFGAGNVDHGFVDNNGVFTTIDDPLATGGTELTGINDSGDIVGIYTDATGEHGFVASATTPVAWASGVSGDFAVAGNWGPAGVPGPLNDVALSPSGTYTVTSSTNETVNSLSTAAGATLMVTGGTFTIGDGTGSGVNAGALVAAGGLLKIIGPIAGNGSVTIEGGSLDLDGSYAGTVTFSGPLGTFIGDAGNHNLVGDGDANALDYATATSGVTFDLITDLAYNNFGGATVGVDHFSNIAIFYGGSGNDNYIGGPGHNVFVGGSGVNTLDYSGPPGPVVINLAIGEGQAQNGFGGVDNFANIEIFKTGSSNATFVGGGATNHAFLGGSGLNTLDYSTPTDGTGVVIDFATSLAYNNFGGLTVNDDKFSNIQIFDGGAGVDTFIGGPGNHVINGEGGPNILDYSAATTNVEFDVATGIAYNNFTNANVTTDYFSNIQIFCGGSGGADFGGGPGNNVFVGGGGVNTLDYSQTSAPVAINLVTDSATNGYGGTDYFADIQTFKGGSGPDYFDAAGSPGIYTLVGGGNSDIFGFSGAFGQGTITDFNLAHDQIYLASNEFANFAAVQSHAQQVGGNTVITLDASDSITLQNTALSSLNAGEFRFL